MFWRTAITHRALNIDQGPYHESPHSHSRIRYLARNGHAGYAQSTEEALGIVIGGTLGTIIGGEIDGGYDKSNGQLIGAAIGGTIGYVIGDRKDDRRRYRQYQVGQQSYTRG